MDNTSVVRFLAVVDQGNFASAARHLGVTPQALSISIAKLEEELKLTLFDRVPGGITQLTDLGKALVPHARSLVAAERRAVEEVQAIRDARSGWVRIGVGEAMTGSFAAKAISELKREAPDATVAVVEGYVDDLLNRLDQGELDLVAGAPDMRRGHRRPFKQVFLHTSREAVFCRRDHPLVGRAQGLLGMVWLPRSYAQDLLAFGITTSFFYGSQGAFGVFTTEIFPTRIRATGLAFAASCPTYLGFALFPSLMPWAVSHLGWQLAFSVLSAPALVLAALAVLFMPNFRSGIDIDEMES
jgi:DNA-binding transcriptional LysR family regulator